jgi:uncharacterized protein (TIGR02569 family)
MIGSVSPSQDVLNAFGATDGPTRIAGGQGQTYRSGQVVLKPAKDDPETNWIAEFYLTVDCDGFQLPKPIRSVNGAFVHRGWQAWDYIEGQHLKGRWIETIDTCIRFHQAIAGFPRPIYFDRRDQNPWVVADKVAWGEMEIEHHPRIAPAIEQLCKCLRPVNERSQLIHGDFGGNVMFSDNHPPAVIDFAPYWRSVEFAVGVVIADAIVWEGADKSLMDAGRELDGFYQHLARAELRRVIEIETLYQMYGRDMLGQIEAHMPLIRAICERCS